MFDIGFSELVLVFIVGLVVLGPQRLPIAIRTVMGWVRTVRGLAANVQNELAQELKLQELKDNIKKAEELNLRNLSPELSKTVDELKASAQKMQADLHNASEKIKPLTDEQVSAIQNKIEQEHQQLQVQNEEQFSPLAEEASHESATDTQQSADELAELAETAYENLSAYYPPDDELADEASQPTEGKTNV